ncbi:MAG: hypothetical protein ACLFOY_14670 [Desulfatibacillaceae bacterium]
MENTNELYEKLSLRYMADTARDDVEKHLEMARRLGRAPARIAVEATIERHSVSVTVCARDRTGLFSRIAGVFALHDLSVLDARIYTWKNGLALDIFKVYLGSGNRVGGMDWKRVEQDLCDALSGAMALDTLLSGRVRTEEREGPANGMQPRVILDSETLEQYTLVEVRAADSHALLYRITRALSASRVDIVEARISTFGSRCLDVFRVREPGGGRIRAARRLAAIRESLLAAVGSGPAGAGGEWSGAGVFTAPGSGARRIA